MARRRRVKPKLRVPKVKTKVKTKRSGKPFARTRSADGRWPI